jgi:hypothetical protein
MVEMFQYPFVSKSCFSFQNIIFIINVAQVSEKS